MRDATGYAGSRTGHAAIGATAVADGPGAAAQVVGRRAPPTVVVLGPPGAGKGTQCRLVANVTGCAHLSPGAVFREEIARGSPLGLQVRPYVDRGVLVPDELVVAVAARYFEQHPTGRSVLLDGFPRTVEQAAALDAIAPGAVALCLALVVPREQLLARLFARGRDDDRLPLIRDRLLSFERDTRPLLDWYARRGLVRYVDGTGSPADVTCHVQYLLSESFALAAPTARSA